MTKMQFLRKFLTPKFLFSLLIFHWLNPISAEQVNFSLKPITIMDDTPGGQVVGNLGNAISEYLGKKPGYPGPVKYNVMQHSCPAFDYFGVNPSTGEITSLKTIDRDLLCQDPKVQSNIQCCKDNSQICTFVCLASVELGPGETHFIDFSLTVVDLNDHAPAFDSPIIETTVEEQMSSKEYTPKKIKINPAKDVDSKINGVSKYILEGGDGRFRIEHPTVIDQTAPITLIVADGLDRESKATYEMKLIALDGGHPTLTGSATLRIKVLGMSFLIIILQISFNNLAKLIYLSE